MTSKKKKKKKKIFIQTGTQFCGSISHQVLDQFSLPRSSSRLEPNFSGRYHIRFLTNSHRQGLFSFLVQKSAFKVLKTGYSHTLQANGGAWLRYCQDQIPIVASLYCYAHLHEWLLTTLQRFKIMYVVLLPVHKFFGMEVWNGIWKKILV